MLEDREEIERQRNYYKEVSEVWRQRADDRGNQYYDLIIPLKTALNDALDTLDKHSRNAILLRMPERARKFVEDR